jgi:hypothetical protein
MSAAVDSDFPMPEGSSIDGLKTLELVGLSLFLRGTMTRFSGRDRYPGKSLCPAGQRMIASNVATLRRLVASTCDFVQAVYSSDDGMSRS